MTRIIATLLAVLMTLGPAHLLAQESSKPELTTTQKERLVELIDEGKTAYNEGRFDAALKSFQTAHEIYPHPDILYRMALCHERLGEDQQAVTYYKQFLAEVPEAPERARIEKTIEVIESRIAKSEIRIVTQPEGAVVFIDDEANGPAGYTPTELPVKPGNYRVIVKKEGFDPVEELVEVGSGQSVALRYQLSSVTDGRKVSGPGTIDGNQVGDSRRSSFDPTWVILMAVGLGALTTSALFYQPYRSAADNVDKFEENPQNISREVAEEEKGRRDLYLGLTLGSAALGVGFLIWSFVAYSSSSSQAALPGADDGVRVTGGPTPDASGAQIGLGWSW